LDEVGRLLVVELVVLDQAELDGGGRHALLEVAGVESELVAEELDRVVVAGRVVDFGHPQNDSLAVCGYRSSSVRRSYRSAWSRSSRGGWTCPSSVRSTWRRSSCCPSGPWPR